MVLWILRAGRRAAGKLDDHGCHPGPARWLGHRLTGQVLRYVAELDGRWVAVLGFGSGGGRKKLAGTDPGLRPAPLALVDPASRGDPESPLRWTTLSLRNLSGELTRRGHRAGPDTVAGLLKEEGFSLKGNAKEVNGTTGNSEVIYYRNGTAERPSPCLGPTLQLRPDPCPQAITRRVIHRRAPCGARPAVLPKYIEAPWLLGEQART